MEVSDSNVEMGVWEVRVEGEQMSCLDRGVSFGYELMVSQSMCWSVQGLRLSANRFAM